LHNFYAEVTAGDADDFSEYLKSKGTADNSRRRYLGIAKLFFTWAVRHKLIAENPFADQKTTVGVTEKRTRKSRAHGTISDDLSVGDLARRRGSIPAPDTFRVAELQSPLRVRLDFVLVNCPNFG
jgi:hypothetical protein